MLVLYFYQFLPIISLGLFCDALNFIILTGGFELII